MIARNPDKALLMEALSCDHCDAPALAHLCPCEADMSEQKLTARLDAMIRQNAFLRLALLDIHQRESAQDETTCWVRSRYASIMSLTNWVEKVLDEANAMEDTVHVE